MTPLRTLLERAKEALERRTHRERFALAVMAGTIAMALWAQLLWSAHHERARYTRLVSELQAQNSAMRQARDSIRGAKSQGKAIRSITAEQALTAFADGLRSAGISSVTVLPDAQGRFRLTGNTSFDAWLGWLAKSHGDYGIQVTRLEIEPSGTPGLVKIEATIALAGAR